MTAENIVIELINLLIYYLEDELNNVSNTPNQQFVYGEKTAYVECLEHLSKWEKASENGLNFDIEKRFPL